MPVQYFRSLTDRERSQKANKHLAGYLAFVAGAANAGGFLAVQQYTSHMSGIVSAMADGLVLGKWEVLLNGLGALLSFMLGASCAAFLVNWGRRQRLRSEYAIPLLVEASLLICFGLLGERLERHDWLFVPLTVTVLCFTMGLQNAIVTKISNYEIRTTHVTGMITDLGIELGKLFYWNTPWGDASGVRVVANRPKLKILALLVCLFFVGGIAGAFGFKHIGFPSAMILASLLTLLAAVPVADDLALKLRHLFSRSLE